MFGQRSRRWSNNNIKRWVTLIVIIIMQPCFWNAEYAIMYGQIIQESSIKSDNM